EVGHELKHAEECIADPRAQPAARHERAHQRSGIGRQHKQRGDHADRDRPEKQREAGRKSRRGKRRALGDEKREITFGAKQDAGREEPETEKSERNHEGADHKRRDAVENEEGERAADDDAELEAQIEDEDGRRHPDEAEDELRQGVYGLQHRTLPPTSSSQAMAGASAGSARPARASSAFSARRAEVAPSARILPSPTTIERGQTR